MVRFQLPKWERRERVPDPPGVTIPHYIPAQLKALSWIATAGVFYMLWLFSLNAARDAAAALHITHAATWTGDILFYFPVIVGFLLIAMVVAWTGKVAVPAFVSLRWQGDELWPKAWMLFIMIAVSAVIIAGSITVQTETRFEGNRDSAVASEQVQRGRAGLEANVAAIQRDIDDIAVPSAARPTYQMQACRDGAEAWRGRIATARAQQDYQLAAIERALASAERCDKLKEDRRAAMLAVAQAPTDASVTQRVTVSEADAAMGGFVDWLSAIRSIMLAFIQDIACLLLPWIAMRTDQARRRQLALAVDASSIDEAHMIPDFRDETPVEAQPMEAAKEAVFDAETGERLVKVKAREHWRRVPKGKKQKVDVAETPAGDEAGVFDASRTGLVGSPEAIASQGGEAERPHESDARIGEEGNHNASEPTPAPAAPQVSDDEWAALFPEHAAVTELPGGEGVMVNDEHNAHVREWERQAQQGVRQMEAAE